MGIFEKLRAFAFGTKSMQDWADSSVRMYDQTRLSTVDPASMRALAVANGQVRRCANYNAMVASSCVPRLFRRSGVGGQKIQAKSVSHDVMAYLRGHTANPVNAKSIDVLGSSDAVEVVSGPEVALLRKPNPFQTGSEFRFEKFFYKQVSGDYWAHVVNDSEDGIAILPMLPQFVSVRVGNDGYPTQILYGRDFSKAAGVGRVFLPEECVSWRFRPSPTSLYRGEGWVASAYTEAGLLEKALVAMSASWDNMQRPDWALLLSDSTSAANVADARAAIANRHQGVLRVMRPLVARGVDIKTMSFSPKDTMFDTQIDRMNKTIRNAAGIPEALQDMNASTFDNADASVITHRRDTIYPMLNTDAEQDDCLIELLGLDPSVYFIAYIGVVPDAESVVANRVQATRSETTINERRAWLGLGAEPWGNDPPASSPSFPMPQAPPFAADQETETDSASADPEEQTDSSKSAKKRDPVSIPFRYAKTCCDKKHARKAAPNPLSERGIQRFADSLELWYRRNAENLTVNPNGTVDLGPESASELADLLKDPLSGVSDEAIRRAGSGGVPAAAVANINPQDARRFVDNYVVRLASEISKGTQDELTQAILMAVEGGSSIPDAVAEIRRILPDEAPWRAVRIAKTETATVNMETDLHVWGQIGIEKKQWILAIDACPVCEAFFSQYAAGPVPLDHVYAPAGTLVVGSDGTKYVTWRDVRGYPLHPNCRCDQMAVKE